MEKRALVIGSQTGGLTGVHGDVEVMSDALAALGFDTTRAIERDATFDQVVDRYRGLIADSKAGDAVVIYYSGHGFRQLNALAANRPELPPFLQYLVPTDIDDRSSGKFRGLLAEQLSLLQHQLTDKTDNVTTILDCCHSARMSRDPRLFPKAAAIDPFPWLDVEGQWTAVRDAGAGLDLGDSNPKAVRLVACSPDQSAFELNDTALGGPHGALTAQLVPLLRRPDAFALSWREVIDVVRPAVMDVVSQQRPDVEGIHLGRMLFSTDEKDTTGVLAVVVEGGAAFVESADLFGVAEGDTYLLVGPGGDRRTPLAEATVDLVTANRARLSLSGNVAGALPPGTAAHPLVTAVGSRPVAVVGGTQADRDAVTAALVASAHIRAVEKPTGALATIDLDEGVQLLDAAGAPMLAQPRALTPGTLTLITRDLERLARATHLRELASGTGTAELPPEVTVSFARVVPSGGEEDLPISGAQIHSGDHLVMRFSNAGATTRYVSVLDIGLTGAVALMSTSESDGVTLAPGHTYELGRDSVGALVGITMFWPSGLPALPRPETLLAIISDAKVSGLSRLSQDGVATARGGLDDPTSLERLLDEVSVGKRDAGSPESTRPTVRYSVTRCDFVLHPEPRAGEVLEPAFEIDARPDSSFRILAPVPRGAVPKRVAVRLTEIAVHSNRSFLKARVRLDALVLTAVSEGEDAYRAASAHFDRVKDGDRLPLDNLLVYEGPVGRFLDLALWVAKDDHPDQDLTDLLAIEAESSDMKAAIITLGALAVAAPQAAAVAGATAAVATVVRTAGKLMNTLEGTSIGVYRTSLLPHECFGSKSGGIGRRPESGLIRAQDMSFAFEVIDVSDQ